MRTRVLLATALGASVALLSTPVPADNVVGVSKASAEKIARQLAAGQLLIWNCPTCRGLQVMKVESVKVSRWGLSPDFAVMVRRDVLIRSGKTFEALAGMRCTDPARQRIDEAPDGWPVDLTYTYAQTGEAARFVSVGRSVGVDNNAVPAITLTPESIANVERCAAKHRRDPGAFDAAGDPLAERLVSGNDAIRAAALVELKATVNRMPGNERRSLMDALIEEMGDVGTIEEGPGTSGKAQQAALAAGAAAAPYLVRAVSDASEDVVTREVAARTLGRIRPAAKESIPALLALLKSEHRSPPRGGIAFALGAMGIATPQVVDALTQALAYRHPDIPDGIDLNSYAEIAIALGKLGRDAKAAVPVLLRSLDDANAYARINAALALIQLDPGNAKPLDVLRRILADPALGQVQDALLLAIEETGPAASDAVPVLAEALESGNPGLDRQKLVAALDAIGTPAAKAAAGQKSK